jgi:hypothetical protein
MYKRLKAEKRGDIFEAAQAFAGFMQMVVYAIQHEKSFSLPDLDAIAISIAIEMHTRTIAKKTSTVDCMHMSDSRQKKEGTFVKPPRHLLVLWSHMFFLLAICGACSNSNINMRSLARCDREENVNRIYNHERLKAEKRGDICEAAQPRPACSNIHI